MDWSEGELKERHFEILPQLLTALNTRKDANKALEVVFSSIVSMVPVECLEEVIFSEFCHLTADYYCELIGSAERLLSSNDKEEENMSSRVGSFMEACLEVLRSISNCTEYLTTVVGELRASGIKSLATGALVIVEETYKHCQGSATTYGVMFSPMSALLSEMFKKSFDLHSGLLRLIEEMHFEREEEKNGDLELLAYVANKSVVLCDVVSKVDRNATIGPWKFIFRMCNGFDLEKMLDSNIIITILVGQITSMMIELQETRRPEDEGRDRKEELERSCKFVDFLFRILGFVVEKCRRTLGGMTKELAEFIFRIKDISILDVRGLRFGDRNLALDLGRSVSVATDSLVGLLADSNEFLMMITSEGRFGSGEAFKRLSILLAVLRRAESINVAGWSSDASKTNESLTNCTLVRRAFELIGKCSTLSFVRPSSDPYGTLSSESASASRSSERLETPYEEALRSIGAYVVKLHERHFTEIEDILLENLFHTHFLNSLMSSDLWYFLARSSPGKVGWRHFSTLLKLLENLIEVRGNVFQVKRKKEIKGETDRSKIDHFARTEKMLRLTVNRMFRLLTTEQQVAAFDARPIVRTMAPPPGRAETRSVSGRRFRDCISNLSVALDAMSTKKSSKDLHSLLNHLLPLPHLLHLADSPDRTDLTNLKSILEKLLRTMLRSVKSEFQVRDRIVSLALSVLLELTVITKGAGLQSRNVQSSYEGLTRTIRFLIASVKDESSNDETRSRLTLSFCPFIASLSRFEFSCKDEGPVGDALRSIAELTTLCSAVRQPFVKEHLLQVFADFLRCTPNDEIPLLIGRSKLEGGAMVTRFVQKLIGRSESIGYFEDVAMENLNSFIDGDAEEDDEEEDEEEHRNDVRKSDEKWTVDDVLSTVESCLESLKAFDVHVLLEEERRIRLTRINKAFEDLL